MNIRFIDAGTVSGFRSQSIYHGLGYAQTAHTPNTVVLATPGTPYMCIGFFQDVENELDVAFCQANGLPVIRRETGGGAVYIDKDQLFIQWIFQQSSLPPRVDQRFQLFVKPLIETYKFFGINAYYHPINDVHVNGKKIVGTGAGTIGEGEIVTGNIMFNFNYDTMINAINVPNDAFREAVRRNMKQFLTHMNMELVGAPTVEEVKEVYKQKCAQVLGVNLVDGEFTQLELEKMEQVEAKFKQDKWLFQTKRKAPLSKLFKIHSDLWIGYIVYNQLRVLLTMKNNTIAEITLEVVGEQPSAYSVVALQDCLIGVLMDKALIKAAVKKWVNDWEANNWTNAIYKVKELQLKQTGNGAVARSN